MTKQPPPEEAFRNDLRELLQKVAQGDYNPESAVDQVRDLMVKDLGYAKVDTHRLARRGRPEAIFGQGKTAAQIIDIAEALVQAGQNVLVTRLNPGKLDEVAEAFRGWKAQRNDRARTLLVTVNEPPRKSGTVGVVCAGTTDIPVAEEAAVTAEALGSPVERLYDVGVAGIHRLLRHREALERLRVLVVAAGMEGALASVVGGLVRAPVIAVPTSVGYGASFGGLAALLGMLNSCAPGVSVVNIDNGYGAGYLADVINEIGEVEEDKPNAPSGESI
ncbi:nickel pincer cofactor biosynthesis protein LarB [bacterium]|nr:nickel pincer cofactor biosynthesis protein LarB [bacterium]